ncbi:hypothetical protein HK101_004781 [Irineochytrium annulatum]|nr:hypothetical protein HK101_004781 [Irineochytrium annulatum]
MPSVDPSNTNSNVASGELFPAPGRIRCDVVANLTFYKGTTDGQPPYRYVAARRCPDGVPRHNVINETHPITIRDLRGSEQNISLDRHAFLPVRGAPTSLNATVALSDPSSDFAIDAKVKAVYYPEVEELLKKEVAGVHTVHVFSHILRSGTGLFEAASKPADAAHVDQTWEMGWGRVDLLPDEAMAARARAGQERVRIINVWRPIIDGGGPLQDHPLAFADSRTVEDDSMVAVKTYLWNRDGENAAVKYAEGQEWWYWSGMESDDVLLIKCFDSDTEVGGGEAGRRGRTPHTSFVHSRTPEGAKARESIEMSLLRCLLCITPLPDMLLPTLSLACWLAAAVFAAPSTLAPNEPPDGKAANFQLVQTIPVSMAFGVPNVANLSLLTEGTDASVFITIYPNTGTGDGISEIKQSDYDDLASQVQGILNSTGRSVFIRYAPEMNGDWMIYNAAGPTAFFASWRKMVNTVRALNPAKVAFVWSPNIAIGAKPYADWYPGDAYVDWVGLSIYWKGPYPDYPWIKNTLADPSFFTNTLDLDGFYQTYSVAANKPFMMSEGGGTYHLNYSDGGAFQPCGGVTNQSQIIMSFWNSFLFNPAFYASYPKAKMFNMFEFLKEESDMGTHVWRDFRATFDPATVAAFTAQLQTFTAQGLFQWANAVAPVTTTTTTTASATMTATVSAAGTTASAAVTSVDSSSMTTTKASAGVATVSAAVTMAMGLIVLVAVFVV